MIDKRINYKIYMYTINIYTMILKNAISKHNVFFVCFKTICLNFTLYSVKNSNSVENLIIYYVVGSYFINVNKMHIEPSYLE